VGYEDTTHDYPLLVVLNGTIPREFCNALAASSKLSSDARIPELILIGISGEGWNRVYLGDCRGGPLLKDVQARRDWLCRTLPETLEKRFRVSRFHVLYAQSNSALFGLMTLLKHPHAYSGVILGSPMVGWCPDAVEARIVENRGARTNTRLFMEWGSNDSARVTSSLPRIVKLMDTIGFKGNLACREIQNGGHVPYGSLYDGLIHVFQGWEFTGEGDVPLDALLAHYRQQTRQLGMEGYPVPFPVLLKIGYGWLEKGNHKEAEKLFGYAVNAYPDSATSWFLLGTALEKKGELKRALDAYRKSVVIRPILRHRQAVERVNALLGDRAIGEH